MGGGEVRFPYSKKVLALFVTLNLFQGLPVRDSEPILNQVQHKVQNDNPTHRGWVFYF
jgi:hypothetical protein